MPTHDYLSTYQAVMASALRRFGCSLAIRPKRLRRPVPYASELLQRSRVNYGAIRGRRR